MSRPAKDPSPRVYHQGGLLSRRVGWPTQDPDGSWVDHILGVSILGADESQGRQSCDRFIMGWSISGQELAHCREGSRMGSHRIANLGIYSTYSCSLDVLPLAAPTRGRGFMSISGLIFPPKAAPLTMTTNTALEFSILSIPYSR